MKTRDPTRHTAAYWPRSGRPIQPYRINHNINDPDPLTAQPVAYLLDPIHPRLLDLTPGKAESFLAFVEQVGISEFLEWVENAELHAWNDIFESFRGDPSVFTDNELAKAWSDPHTVTAVRRERDRLREFYAIAMEAPSPGAVTRIVLSEGWARKVFEVDLFLDDDTGVLCERPRHMWDRAWFELLDGLHQDRLPKLCGYCGLPFVPRRTNQAYCPGKPCQQRAADQRRSRTDDRREYQRNKYQERKRKKQSPSRTTEEE